MAGRTDEISIREADEDDVVPALRVVEGALLDVEADRVRERAAAGELLVADRDGSVVGAIVLDSGTDERPDAAHVLAVAVTRQRRSGGIGTTLVEAAADRHDRLTADFRPEVKGFWEALRFEIRAGESDGSRLHGWRE